VRSLPLWNSHSSSKEPKERKAKTVSVISPLTKPIKLDLLSRESFVRQVANSLRQQIASGELPKGERLHVETIARIYDVSKRTANRALTMLEGEGLVAVVPSRGTFVARKATPSAQE
jgi:DNA-binding GntR family transcriptional regulator